MELRQIREDKGLSQKDVAVAARISRAAYTNIERGKRRPSPEAAQRIAAYLEFDWTRFYTEKDVKSNDA